MEIDWGSLLWFGLVTLGQSRSEFYDMPLWELCSLIQQQDRINKQIEDERARLNER